MSACRPITRADILSREDYARERAERRRRIIELKRRRRVEVGPLATFYFENRETMLQQIHEMLWIEKGGEEQIADELAAYAPLAPRGDELVATLMFEIDDPVRRHQVLSRLGYVEDSVSLQIGGETVKAVPEMSDGVPRTTEDGKTSSIHFLRFPFTPAQIAKFRDPSIQAVLAIAHEHYAHMAVMPKSVREALVDDFA
jgi:hypothetical protein